jgi:glycosyltransferase involved in cell wall biosynthesis
VSVQRISIGPGDVAGYFSRLKTGFDALGVPCEHFAWGENKFSYDTGNYFLKSAYYQACSIRKSRHMSIRLIGRLFNMGIKLACLIYAVIRFDVFIFTGSSTFLIFRELWLLKLLKKKIIVVYFGSDARPPIFSGRHLDDLGNYVSSDGAKRETQSLRGNIQRVEKYSDFVINHTATAQMFSLPFIRWAAVGMPIPKLGNSIEISCKKTTAVRIVHAPSRPKAKGSDVFRRVINELRQEGYSIEFIELNGVSNATVLQELQKCDLVVDELYSDTPMAMLATEAAMLGKPVVVGGYYAKQFYLDNPDEASPPSIYVEPSEIKSAIEKLIQDVDFRRRKGAQAKVFVSTYWSAENVAQNYLRLIKGDFPRNWISKPEELDYCYGWGLSRESWRRQVKQYIAECGIESLYFEQNRKLVDRVMNEVCKEEF